MKLDTGNQSAVDAAMNNHVKWLMSYGHNAKQAKAISDTPIKCHRNPTASELRFGHGATHYADFDREMWIKPEGTMKKYIISPYDGLRCYR